ncbi:Phosphopantetheine attachment site [Succiniclasticum ruminis]|uniref:Phosphopantetheine attachment site n=1 Tax=Succiniclasticum ruminis TaxID=40841 RepID=A0A1G6HRN7_9FIRM|nr:acyl carrier protein [Succiniclasticum ruminis]SDB96813.1 Phosphopantetheine attachment site [Succiniclasticum ruminis]
MEVTKKLALLEEVMELDEGSLDPDMKLKEIEEYDSMVKLSLIVLMNDEFGKKITVKEINNFVTVRDVIDFMG